MNSSTSKLILEPLEPRHCEYYKWFNDPVVCAGNSHGVYPMTRADALEYIEGLRGRTDIICMAMIEKKVGNHIGNISLQNINYIYRSAELALIIGDTECWGKGYGYEAASRMISHAKNAMGLLRVSCATFDTNYAMRKLAAKLGMVEEGNRIMAAYKNGEFLNIIEYGMLLDNIE